MGKRISAGLLMYRQESDRFEVFLVHPGGPFFKNKDDGAWSIPKGEVEEHEDPLETAIREFQEETGIVPREEVLLLGSTTQKGGKVVYAWAFEAQPGVLPELRSNEFEMEWPPRSGRIQRFPEVDRGDFIELSAARKKINPAQAVFLDMLEEVLGVAS